MDALLIVDVQNDFMPGGALGVEDGNAIIPIVNRLMERHDLVVATKDWHPANHMSFAVRHEGKHVGDMVQLNGLPQVLWPIHCVQHTRGSEFAPGLEINDIDKTFYKGTDPLIDSYSGFFDNGHRQKTGLEDYLRSEGVTTLHIAGLATDYCVKYTTLDALNLGFKTHVIRNACRAVNLEEGDEQMAIREMEEAGAFID